MAREGIRIAGSESAAFDKLIQGLRWSVEATTEIGHYRGDPQWMQGAIIFQQMLDKMIKLRSMSAARRGTMNLDEIIKAGRKAN